MKNTTLTLILFVITFNLMAQKEKDTLFVNQIYQDASKLIVSVRVLNFDNINRDELIQRFENWGGQNFRSYQTVRTSKTDSQITLRYNSLGVFSVMTAEFKDNKIRISIQDDGDATPQFPWRNSFVDGMLIYKTKPGYFNYAQQKANAAITYKTNTENDIKSISDYIKNNKTAGKSDF